MAAISASQLVNIPRTSWHDSKGLWLARLPSLPFLRDRRIFQIAHPGDKMQTHFSTQNHSFLRSFVAQSPHLSCQHWSGCGWPPDQHQNEGRDMRTYRKIEVRFSPPKVQRVYGTALGCACSLLALLTCMVKNLGQDCRIWVDSKSSIVEFESLLASSHGYKHEYDRFREISIHEGNRRHLFQGGGAFR